MYSRNLNSIFEYNRDDCIATLMIAKWLIDNEWDYRNRLKRMGKEIVFFIVMESPFSEKQKSWSRKVFLIKASPLKKLSSRYDNISSTGLIYFGKNSINNPIRPPF